MLGQGEPLALNETIWPSHDRPSTKHRWWTVDEVRKFLKSTRRDHESLYAAFVLILALDLRKGEVLGLIWELVTSIPLSSWSSREPTTDRLTERGSIPAWCSPPVMAQRSSRGASAAASIAASPGRRLPGLPCTAPGRPASPCGPPSTCVRARPCRSCDTARSRSPRRSTPRFPRPPPAMRSASSHSGLIRIRGPLSLRLLHFCSCTKIKNGRLHDHNWPLSWVGDTAIEPVTSSV